MSEDTFGQYLKSQRELRQISLEEVAAGTKIGIHLLKALEEDRWDILPAEVFIKGFIKSYAEYIGLDPEDTLLRYEAIKQKDMPQKEEQEFNIPRRYNGPLGLKSSIFLKVLIAIIFILLIGLGIYFVSNSSIKLNFNIFNNKKEQKIERFNNNSSINLNHQIIQSGNSIPTSSNKVSSGTSKVISSHNNP